VSGGVRLGFLRSFSRRQLYEVRILIQNPLWSQCTFYHLLGDTEQETGTLRSEPVGSRRNSNTPAEAAGGASKLPIKLDNFHWQTHCKGLYQLPIAA
jgi:hypothetical protein